MILLNTTLISPDHADTIPREKWPVAVAHAINYPQGKQSNVLTSARTMNFRETDAGFREDVRALGRPTRQRFIESIVFISVGWKLRIAENGSILEI